MDFVCALFPLSGFVLMDFPDNFFLMRAQCLVGFGFGGYLHLRSDYLDLPLLLHAILS